MKSSTIPEQYTSSIKKIISYTPSIPCKVYPRVKRRRFTYWFKRLILIPSHGLAVILTCSGDIGCFPPKLERRNIVSVVMDSPRKSKGKGMKCIAVKKKNVSQTRYMDLLLRDNPVVPSLLK
ncbi:hypothetical protein M9H77_07795 [Catharanthus roseus]|uniref:Uncharacterized protein n=1 Tax=Catharanthus roseus TaxID=4058 RepID=A0ACC0BW55_CATRO|nr:hypothetical protein M9H77_07795 [Catharanthus roseus]